MQIYNNTLTVKSVSIKSDEYGMRAYVNSTRGRAQLEAECPADIVKAVEAVWGSKPTVTEPVLSPSPAPQPSSTDKQLAAMELHQAQTDNTVKTAQTAIANIMLKLAGGK